MNRLRLTCVALGFLLSFTNVSAAEQESRAYFGLELGFGWADMKAQETAQALANATGNTVTYTYDAADLVGRLSFGYWLTDQFALEVGYFSSADYEATYNGTYSGTSWTAKESYSATGLDVSGVLKPSGSDFFFKAGFHDSEVDGVGSFSIAGLSVSTSATYSGSSWLAGGGYEWDLGDASAILSYTFYNDIGGLSTGDLGLLSATYKFKF